MAVPPADDGELTVIDPAAESPTSRRGTPRTVLAIFFAVVVLAMLGVLGVRFGSADGSAGNRFSEVFGGGTASSDQDAARRDEVLKQATQFMLRLNTYGPGDLDEQLTMPDYAERVRAVITPKLAVGFQDNVTLAEQSVAKAGYARSAQVFSSGVETIDDSTATVLVAGVLDGSYPDAKKKDGRIEFEPQPFRVAVSLVRIEGSWLVDDFNPVVDPSTDTSGDTGFDGLSGDPTDPASSSPSTVPPTPKGTSTGGPTTDGKATSSPSQGVTP